jgi:phosphonate transport system substrate-binding protein
MVSSRPGTCRIAERTTMPRKVQLTYYPWITQSISGGELATAIKSFADIVSADLTTRLGEAVSVEVLPEMDVSDQIAHIKAAPGAGVDGVVALMNPLGYAAARESEPAVVAVAVVRRQIPGSPAGPTYRAQIYVNALTGISRLEELRKRSFAFGSPQSTSNFLVPAHLLWSNGVHPLHAFSTVTFAGGHEKVAEAVYKGLVDAGAGHDGAIVDLAARRGYSNAAERLTRIAWSPDIPSDPVAFRSTDAALQTAVVASLCAIAPTNDATAVGNQAIKAFWGTTDGLEQIAPDAYAVLLSSARDLGLRPNDMLKKA